MKVVVELSKEEMESYKNVMRFGFGNSAMRKIINGTPLPEGAEILTKEAYSDLCLRASQGRKTGRWVTRSRKFSSLGIADYYFRKCSVCGWEREDCDTKNDTPFCPNCGTKMKGADNENSY